MQHKHEGLFLVGWILATAADMLDREPTFSRSFSLVGKTIKWSTALSAAAIVFFFAALIHVARE